MSNGLFGLGRPDRMRRLLAFQAKRLTKNLVRLASPFFNVVLSSITAVPLPPFKNCKHASLAASTLDRASTFTIKTLGPEMFKRACTELIDPELPDFHFAIAN